MIFDAVVAVFLLISSSLIADDARRWNDIHGGYRPSGFSVDKLIAAAVCRKKQQTINLSFVTPLLKGHLCSGDTKFGPVKMFS